MVADRRASGRAETLFCRADMMMRYALAPLLLLGVPAALAQDTDFRCLANNPVELARHLAADPNALQRAAGANAELNARGAAFSRGGAGPFVIPVVFHIIHNNGEENISDAQVTDALRVLNEDYNKQNPDWVTVRPEFLDRVADVGIEFRLAQRDPEGNCTNGITRTASTLTAEGDFAMTQLIQWPRDRYMNIWVCRHANGAAGYTYYPMWLDGWPEADGIVVQHNYVGSIGTSVPYRSRVLSHEVGHWLNLKHCWGDSNEPGEEANCGMDDDVEDTPLTRGWTSCVTSGASCGSDLDNVQNYMEYAYCSRMFTQGQAQRMLAALTSSIAQRENLWQPSNLALTGVDAPGTVCEARFLANRRTVCAGGSITFSDESFNGVVQRSWSFPGGEPALSDAQVPTITYNEPGLYPVSLAVSDSQGGTVSRAEEAYIRVLPATGQPVPWSEGFEQAATLAETDWEVIDRAGDGGFEATSVASFSGSRSARLSNSILSFGRTDELISATIDLSGAPGAVVTFRYAYAKRYVADDDALYVWVSPNCGDTWMLRKVMRGNSSLLTAGVVPGDFVPNGPDQWGVTEITNIGPNLCSASFRLRFEFVSDGGNNLYIDDINILSGLVGMDDPEHPASAVRLASDGAGAFDVMLSLREPDRVGFEVLDALGRRLVQVAPSAYGAGAHRLRLPVQGLPAGSYLLRAAGASLQEAVRFMMP